MNLKPFYVLCFLSSIAILTGCGSTVDKVANDPSCNKKLAFVESKKNEVSEDGFTIFYDGKDSKVLESLLKRALENQKSTGCNNG